MPTYDDANYTSRPVKTWLTHARTGQLSLPTFQRSYKWDNQRVAGYLKALFENRPTGVFLILPTTVPAQLKSRPIAGSDEVAEELVLDGQQRLKSLWLPLAGIGDTRFYVQVLDIANDNLEVDDVVYYSRTRGVGTTYETAAKAYAENLIPLDVLGSRACNQQRRAIWKWCREAVPDDVDRARCLEDAIKHQLRDRLLSRNLWYCRLPISTQADTAVRIFIDTNRSPLKINAFDIVVALAEQHEEDLRDRIGQFHSGNSHVRPYFPRDPEQFIPEIGSWYLRVACLLAGQPPKESKYDAAFKFLVSQKPGSGRDLGGLEDGIGEALAVSARNGAPTQGTLPSRPPVYVVAALQRDLRKVRSAAGIAVARDLVARYLWRSCLTERHEARANDYLFRDYKQIRECLQQIARDGTYDPDTVEVFKRDDYPLPDADYLFENLGWIGVNNRLARAVAAAVAFDGAVEWFDGERLDQTKVVELESSGQLERHHIFPRHILKGRFERAQINNGLNGVWLPKRANISLSKVDPRDYVPRMVQQIQNLSKSELRQRIESHKIPYEIMMAKEPVETRYPRFLRARAQEIASLLTRLARDTDEE